MQPTLLFEFANQQPMLFQQPSHIFCTYDYNEVNTILEEIKQATQQGFYAAGYISYEATYPLMNLHITKQVPYPLIWFGIFTAPVQQNQHNEWQIGNFSVSSFQPSVSKNEYLQIVANVINELQASSLKQINYTTPFIAQFSGDAYAYYMHLKRAQRAKFNAFLDLDSVQIVSVSPEMFFQKQGNRVTVRPMKGTIRRGKTFEEDQQLKNWLFHSEKNRLENDMITRLMQEELNEIASDVKITNQYTIEKYPTVYQMTSTLNGNVKGEHTAIEVLKALFPCGSISGFPKKASIQKIAAVEPYARGVYTGAIGYITPEQDAIFNVPIRTVVIDNKAQQATYYAGGAITTKSTAVDEYQEMVAKTNVLNHHVKPFQLLETLRLESGNYFLLENHFTRLKASADYFSFPLNLAKVMEALNNIKKDHPSGNWKVRITVDERGNIEAEAQPFTVCTHYKARLAKAPIDAENVFLYHKTTERTIFAKHLSVLPATYDDVLLWNERNEITEFTIGNIVVEKAGKRYTPPISSGLLPGTFRQELLKQGMIEEKVLYVNELPSFERIWLINSVRQWVEVTMDLT